MKNLSRTIMKRSAFTLVELLVVIAIIGILIGMLLPAVQQVREASRRVSCLNQMRQLSLACMNYESAHEHFPPASVCRDGQCDSLNWIVYTLPFIEQENLHSQFDLRTNGLTIPNKWDLSANRLAGVLCPSAEGEFANHGAGGLEADETHTTHYNCITGPIGENPSSGINYEVRDTFHGGYSAEGVFWTETNQTEFAGRESRGFGGIQDGSSNTFLIGEMSYSVVEDESTTFFGPPYRGWARGGTESFCSPAKNIRYPINAYDFDETTTKHNNINMGSNHTGGCNFSYADGSSHFVSESVDMAIYLSQASAAGGEAVAIE